MPPKHAFELISAFSRAPDWCEARATAGLLSIVLMWMECARSSDFSSTIAVTATLSSVLWLTPIPSRSVAAVSPLGRAASAVNDISVIIEIMLGECAAKLLRAYSEVERPIRFPRAASCGSDLKQLIDGGRLKLILGFRAERIEEQSDGLVVTGRGSSGTLTLPSADRIIVATGQRPDLSMTRELRLDLDLALESPRALGPMIDPNLHSCGTCRRTAIRNLRIRNRDISRSASRATDAHRPFLWRRDYEQVRSVTSLLTGDHVAADDVRLACFPKPGSARQAFPGAEVENGCCGGPAPEQSGGMLRGRPQCQYTGNGGLRLRDGGLHR